MFNNYTIDLIIAEYGRKPARLEPYMLCCVKLAIFYFFSFLINPINNNRKHHSHNRKNIIWEH